VAALAGPPGSWGRRMERLAARVPAAETPEPVSV